MKFGYSETEINGRPGFKSRQRLEIVFSSQYCLNQICGPTSLASSGYRGPSLRGYSSKAVKLTSYLNLVAVSRKLSFISTPSTYSWCGEYLTKHSNNFTLELRNFIPVFNKSNSETIRNLGVGQNLQLIFCDSKAV
jgi:hypothetical protein